MRLANKFYLWVLGLLFAGYATGQNFSSSTYPFVSGTQTLFAQPAGADTLITPGQDNFITPLIPIGFGFNYCTRPYDSLSVNSDGYVRLGNAATNVGYVLLDSTIQGPAIVPYWLDMTTGSNGLVTTWLTGSYPNRRRIVQWKTTVPKNITATANATFQLVLHECTGVIRFVYNNTPSSPGAYYAVGFNNLMNGRLQNVKVQALSSGAIVHYNSNTISSNTAALNSRSFAFYPDSAKPAAPGLLRFYSGNGCGFISWSDSSTTELAFNVYRSTDSINFQFLGSVTSVTGATTGRRYVFNDNQVNGQKYHYRITANSMGGDPSDTLTGTFIANAAPLSGTRTIPTDYLTLTEAYQHIKCAQLAGPLVLEVENSYDTLQEIFPVNIDGNYNHTASNTLIIRPAANVTQPVVIASFPRDSTAIQIKNTSYLTIDGRAGGNGPGGMLAIRAGSGYKGLLHVAGNSTNNTFRNIHFMPRDSDATGCCFTLGMANVVTSDTATLPNRLNVFEDCDFENSQSDGWAPLYFRGSSTANNDSNIVLNCRLRNYRSSGVLVDLYNRNTIIADNSFYHTMNDCRFLAAINVTDSTGGDITIQDNYFGGTQPYANGGPSVISASQTYGILTRRSQHQTCHIHGNVFRNIKTTFGSQSYTAMQLSGGNNLVGTLKGNLMGDTLSHTINLAGSFYGVKFGVNTANPTANFEIANNIVSGVSTGFTSAGLFSDSRNFEDTDTGFVSISIHHNWFGYPGLARAFRTAYGGSYLAGVWLWPERYLGDIRIDSNVITNLFGCDTNAYNNGALTLGIYYYGLEGYPTGDKLYRTDTVSITGNEITNLTTWGVQGGAPNEGACGIFSWNRTGETALVKGNTIKNIYVNNGWSLHRLNGIFVQGSSIVHNNRIQTLVNYSYGTSHTIGISTKGYTSCINNLVNIGNDSSGNDLQLNTEIRGIYSYAVNDTIKPLEYYNNSVFIGGTEIDTPFSNSSACFELFFYNNPKAVMKNNIFYNHRREVPWLGNFPHHVAFSVTPNTKADYNIYYADGAGAGITFIGEYYPPDTTSVQANPLFVRSEAPVDSIDMHLSVGSPGINLALHTPAVLDDIDGKLRPTLGRMDAGCYENYLVIPPTNVPPVITTTPTVICSGDSVVLDIIAQTGASYQWKVDGNNTGTDTSVLVAYTSGLYTVDVTNTLGTFLSANAITVTVNPTPPKPTITQNSPAVFCMGDSLLLTAPAGYAYVWNNSQTMQSILVKQSGVYMVTVSNGFGCSAVADTLSVMVHSLDTTVTGQLSFCKGDTVELTAASGLSYYWSTGEITQTISAFESALFSVEVTDTNGCSATGSVTTTMLAGSLTPLTVAKCAGSVYYHDIFSFPVPDTFYIYYSNMAGCDSVIALTVVDTNTVYGSLTDSICDAEYYNFNGMLLNQAGIYTDTLQAAGGCDSVAILHLTIRTAGFSSSFSDSICIGGQYNYAGSTYTQTGTYIKLFASAGGCDSTVTLHLKTLPLPTPALSALPDTVCKNSSALSFTGTPTGGVFTVDGVNNQVFHPAAAAPGVHTITYTYTNTNNCTATDTHLVYVALCTGISEVEGALGVLVYPNPSTGVFTVELAEAPQKIVVLNNLGEVVETITTTAKQTTINLHAHAAGVYTAVVYTGQESKAYRLVKQ